MAQVYVDSIKNSPFQDYNVNKLWEFFREKKNQILLLIKKKLDLIIVLEDTNVNVHNNLKCVNINTIFPFKASIFSKSRKPRNISTSIKNIILSYPDIPSLPVSIPLTMLDQSLLPTFIPKTEITSDLIKFYSELWNRNGK